MSNVIDYLKWRGDLSFDQDPLNEVDNIVLSRISYLPFEDIYVEPRDSIKNIARKIERVPQSNFCWAEDKMLIQELAKTKRFQNLIISDCVQKIDLSTEKQFGAITIWLPNGEKYISFEGTDMSIVGWKEDFNMSFLENIPSQLEAVKYLEKIADKYIGNIILGGHSKGGNLSVYSAIFCDDTIKERIVEILNIDGPGLTPSTMQNEGYKKIYKKIKTYLPQFSVIGRLLEHEEEYTVVLSNEKGLMQHNVYSWQIDGTKLIKLPELTDESYMVNKIIKEWINTTKPEQRKDFIDLIYAIVGATESKTIGDFSSQWITNVKKIIKKYKTIDAKERKEFENMVKLTLSLIKKCLKEENTKKLLN